MITRRVRAALVALPVVALSVLGGCTANNQGGSGGTNAAGSNTINVKNHRQGLRGFLQSPSPRAR